MWRGYGRGPYRHFGRMMRRGWGGWGGYGPWGGWGYRGYGMRRGPCCCLFFALPIFLLPLAAVALLAMHVI